ncbi:MAG: lamin tail domain-containing protein, partial [Leptospiraceae bacterium]|nr:lamin tail domain-containing protein [Leptospiraceae bacterium]
MRTPWFILIWVAVGISCAGPGYIEEPPPSHEHIRLLLSEPWQGHDGHIEETLADTLKRATYAIDCAFASLHSEKIISLLLEKAAHPNIRVRVAFDADVKMSDPGAQKLLESGLFSTEFDLAPTDKLLFGNKGDGRMFYTFCSVDERYNFLASQGIHPTLLTQVPVVAVLAHSDEYGLARELHKEMNMLSQGLFGFRKGKLDFQTKYSVLDQVMAIYWAPQENPMDVLGQELTQVQASVELYATSFQTTNNTQKRLLYDVPTILGGLENLKGKMVKKYFGMSAYWEKNNKVFTLPNPLQYQNPKVVVGTNIFLLDRHLEHPTTFIYIGSLRSRANSSDDGILLELRGRYIAEKIGRYLDKISETSQYVSHIGDESSPGAVKISEVMWMGSYDNNYVAYSSDEFIELYNTTDQIINVSGWRFACTTDGTSNNAAIVLPAGLVIGPKSYFVIATSETGAFAEAANLFEPKLKITNSSRECRLGNGRTSAASYGLANFGTVIDTIGNNTSPFDSASWNRGLNDTTNKVRRSMERIALHTSVGTSNGDWRTNLSTPSDNLQVSPEFRQQTFATPGAPNSGGDVGVPGSVVISEVHWMGSYTNTGTSDSDDEFIELYNTTGNPINISGWRFACTTNGTSANASIFLPPGTIILPHSYLVIATKTTGAFGAVAHIINEDLKITNSSRECRLGDASNSTAVYGLAGFGQSIDIIGNDTHGFDSANWNRGLNETTNRRSMERLNLAALGTSNSNWMTNLNIPANNNQVDINFRQRTFATPGLPATPPPPVLPGDVVINEIMWMGSYPNSGPGESDDEFIELHNKTTNSIHIGLWRISGSGVSTITIPVGETIPPNGYYVIARNNLHAFPSANYYRGTSLGISNSAFEIKLLTSLDFEVDKANNGGAPHAGVQNTDHPFARSMERKSGAVDGTLAASWQSCFAVGSGVAAGHNQRTIATPGAANSTPPVDPAVGDVVINEIMWMGSYNNSGT